MNATIETKMPNGASLQPLVKRRQCRDWHDHDWKEEYYGTRCQKCDLFFAHRRGTRKRMNIMSASTTTEPCKCNCGYRCGGPGVCKLDVDECLQQDDGKHFVKDCGHDFSGPMQDMGNGCQSVVCQKCGISAMGHDMMCGP